MDHQRQPTSGGHFQPPSHSRRLQPPPPGRGVPRRGGPIRGRGRGGPPGHPFYPPPPGPPPPFPYSYPPPVQRRAGYETMAPEKAAMDVLATSLGLKIVDDDINSLSDSESSDTSKDAKDAKEAVEDAQRQKLENAPAGSVTEIKSLYQGPADYQGRTQWIDRVPDDVEEAAENEETAKYALVVRKKKCFDGRRKFDLDSILVNSPELKTILDKVFEGYPGVTCVLQRLVFEAPFAPFVHRWPEFIEAVKKERDPVAKEHLDLLHGVLREELQDTIKAIEDYLVHGVMTFENLWALFHPGAAVYTLRNGSSAALTFVSGNYAKTDSGDAFQMCLESIGNSGDTCGRILENVDLFAFTGTRPIGELTSCPLSFHPDHKVIREKLVKRGKKYASLAGYHYKSYNGIAFSWDSRGKQVPLTVTGRIIIDSEAFDRFNPDRMELFNDLKEGDFVRSDIVKTSANVDASTRGDYDVIQVSPGMTLTEEANLICKATVTGYSLKLKKWLSFFVDSIGEIEWNDTAFDTLVLPLDTKELLMSFVESQISHKDSFDDIIEGKGKGIIMLLSGAPGVGKTLTAESVAEAMHIPLYMMSAGDLGIRPNEVENNLQDILEMVAKWNAILLLDECDVFLEERTTQELERNKLVSIFLRTLEYYEGILFLTTNRVGNMDTAFQSRIHVSLAYPDLDTISRRKIWCNFLMLKGEQSEISERDLDILAEVKLNGRQIKNVIKTAYLLSLRKKTPLRLENIRTVLAIEGRRPDC